MEFGISHEWSEETLESKTRWFSSLTPEQRMDIFCSMGALILANNPKIFQMKDADVAPVPGRICVLSRP